VTSRTPEFRRVATAWLAFHARSGMFATPAPDLIGISEAARVSPNTSSAHRRKNQFVNGSGAVRGADGSDTRQSRV